MFSNLIRLGFILTSLLVSAGISNQQVTSKVNATTERKVTILFAGDIMQHGPQITAAWNDSINAYSYDPCFQYVAPIIKNYDLAIANLEVTLAGPPYSGYPQFSSPDELASGIKTAGFDIVATANNHSCDRGDKGIIRTIKVLDSIGILRTGTFKDSIDYKSNNPLILEKNSIRIALLNYTYGTNGLSFSYPAMVNLITDSTVIKDLKFTKTLNPDFVIVYFHWGNEYQSEPTQEQKNLAELCRIHGADAIIGSHPHVLQPVEYHINTDSTQRNKLTVYSLGNFVSNQRDRYKDGGAMVGFTLLKSWNRISIIDPQYHLTWVHTPIVKNKKQYYILPVNAPIQKLPPLNDSDAVKMSTFINDSRNHLNNRPASIPESIY